LVSKKVTEGDWKANRPQIINRRGGKNMF